MKKAVCFVLFLILSAFCLVACSPSRGGDSLPDRPVKVMVLSGTTGFGAAQMMHASASGETDTAYSFTVEQNASNVTAALINGSVDVAALPTNAASSLFNKTNGEIQVLALNTRGVLYVVADTGRVNVNGVDDLAGKTVFVPAQNPTFIFKTLCDKLGLDVTVDNSFAEPTDLRTALVSGGTDARPVEIAVLPEPMVTMALSANENLRVVADLTSLWEESGAEGSLIQGCVVVRRAFAETYPEAVGRFLSDYRASVGFLTSNPSDAAGMIVEAGIFANKAVAEKAIPNCNVCCITGADMKEALDPFLKALYDVNPNAVGGSVPGDGFYYVTDTDEK